MLKEGLEYLLSLGRNDVRVTPLNDRYERVVENGVVRIAVIPPSPRQHTVLSLGDLVALAKRHATDYCTTEGAVALRRPVLWVGHTRVVLVCDDTADRRDCVALEMSQSAALQSLLRYQHTAMAQEQFVDLLDIELAQPAALVDQYRSLQWKSSEEAVIDKQLRGAKMRGQFETSAGETVPVDITLTIPVYAPPAPHLTVSIPCRVLVDAKNHQLMLRPENDWRARVCDYAFQHVYAMLQSWIGEDAATIHVYRGCP